MGAISADPGVNTQRDVNRTCNDSRHKTGRPGRIKLTISRGGIILTIELPRTVTSDPPVRPRSGQLSCNRSDYEASRSHEALLARHSLCEDETRRAA